MCGLVLASVRNEKMMGGFSHKLLPVCYYSRLNVSNGYMAKQTDTMFISKLSPGLLTQLVSHVGLDEDDESEEVAWLYPPQTWTKDFAESENVYQEFQNQKYTIIL